jgi:hypothetical protein
MSRDELEAEFLRRLAVEDMRFWRVHAMGQLGGVDDEYDEQTKKQIGQLKRVTRIGRLIGKAP